MISILITLIIINNISARLRSVLLNSRNLLPNLRYQNSLQMIVLVLKNSRSQLVQLLSTNSTVLLVILHLHNSRSLDFILIKPDTQTILGLSSPSLRPTED